MELPRQELKSKYFKGTLSEQNAFFLAMMDPNYWHAQSFTDQIGILCSYLRTDTIRVSFERIGSQFGKTKQCIQKHFEKYQKKKLPNGRPSVLSGIEMSGLQMEIIRLLGNPTGPIYCTFEDLSDFIYFTYGKYVSSNTISHIIHRKFQFQYKTVVGIPMQFERLDISLPELEENLILLSQKINNIPIQFVFNLDETGIVEFADTQKKFVIVPYNYEKKTAPYPVQRCEKHSSCLLCISMAKIHGIPLVAVSRSTVDSELYQYIDADSVEIIHTTEGYVNTAAFKYYMEGIFIPELQTLRKKYNYYEPSILIIDGLIAHRNAVQTLNLANYNIIPHFLPSHSTDETQPLDLGIFSPMKKFCSNFKRAGTCSTQTNQILKALKSCQNACSSMTCQAAFREAGIVVNIEIDADGAVHQFARFDFFQLKHVRYYQREYIRELIANQMPLSPIQQMIYNSPPIQTSNESFRIKIASFENNKK